MLLTNARIFTPQGVLCGALRVENGRFAELLPGVNPAGGTDLGGASVIPGLVDIHTHGNSGADFSDGDAAGLRAMARFLAKSGVTAFAPTTMSLPLPALSAALKTAAALQREAPADCRSMCGMRRPCSPIWTPSMPIVMCRSLRPVTASVPTQSELRLRITGKRTLPFWWRRSMLLPTC